MDFRKMTQEDIGNYVGKLALDAKKAKEALEVAYKELEELGFKAVNGNVDGFITQTYLTEGHINKIYDREKLDKFFGAKADEFKKETTTRTYYSTKITQVN